MTNQLTILAFSMGALALLFIGVIAYELAKIREVLNKSETHLWHQVDMLEQGGAQMESPVIKRVKPWL